MKKKLTRVPRGLTDRQPFAVVPPGELPQVRRRREQERQSLRDSRALL